MKKTVFVSVLLLSLALVSVLVLAPSVCAGSENLIVNGNFETGTLNGWNVLGTCSTSNTTVHSGSYSAYVSDVNSDSWISQELNLPADNDYHFEGWIYPLKVGNLGPVDYPVSWLYFWYYNISTMLPAFHVDYIWCWNDWVQNPLNENTSSCLGFLLSFNQSEWNLLSINLTENVRSYFAGIDLSQFILHNVTAQYHYSNASPGAFYIDDLSLSTIQETTSEESSIWAQWYLWTTIALGITTVVFAFTTLYYRRKTLTGKESKIVVGKTTPTEVRTCSNCGAKWPTDAKFCGKCGKSLE